MCPIPSRDIRESFSDLTRLRQLRRLVESCSPDRASCLKLLRSERLADVHSVAVLAGSFNPLTIAHLALAEAAERHELGAAVFALSTRTIDKEQPEGALLEDRLLVLDLHLESNPGRSAALLNRGLYVDQAQLFRSALPALRELTFLVGFDKIVQIFDPRYYDDRDAALSEFFEHARFAVAPRSGAGRQELADLLARRENRSFASRVQHLELDPSFAQVSAARIRAALAAGEPLPPQLPPESTAFIAATGCYRQEAGNTDSYAQRRTLIAGL